MSFQQELKEQGFFIKHNDPAKPDERIPSLSHEDFLKGAQPLPHWQEDGKAIKLHMGSSVGYKEGEFGIPVLKITITTPKFGVVYEWNPGNRDITVSSGKAGEDEVVLLETRLGKVIFNQTRQELIFPNSRVVYQNG